MNDAPSFDINDQLSRLKYKIREAIQRGYTQCTEITKYTGADMTTVFNVLRRMIDDGEIQKEKDGGLTRYTLVAQKGLTKADITDKILASLRAGFCTLPGIKVFCGLEKSYDLTEHLAVLIENLTIVKFNNGELTAFFEYGLKPKRFWKNDDGTVGVELEEPVADEVKNQDDFNNPTEVVKHIPPKHKPFIGVTSLQMFDAAAKYGTRDEIRNELGVGITKLVQFLQDPELRKAFDDGQAEFRRNNPEARKSRSGQKAFVIHEKVLHTYAEAGFSQEKAAGKLGISAVTLAKKFKENPNLRKIWDDGQKKFAAESASAGVNLRGNKGIVWTPVYLEQLASEFGAYSAAAKSLSLDPTSVRYQVLKNEENTAAWNRGKKIYLQNITTPAPGRPAKSAIIKETKEEMKPQTAQETPAPEAAPQAQTEQQTTALRCAQCDTEFTMESFVETDDGAFCNNACQTAFEKDKPAEVEDEILDLPEVQPEPAAAENDILDVPEKTPAALQLVQNEPAPKEVAVIPPRNGNGNGHTAPIVTREQIGYIELQNGGEISVGFTGNFFAMTPQERAKLNQFADLIQQ